MRQAGFAAALLALPLYPAAADIPPAAVKIHKSYDIIRQGSQIGTNTVDIERRGDRVQVNMMTKVSVKVMFIEAYHLEHEASETWKSGQLVAFNSQTDDNGTKHQVTAAPMAGKLDLTIDGRHNDAPLSLRPASFWDKSFDTQTELFDPANGKQLAVKVKDLGEDKIVIHGLQHQTHHYKISGDLNRDVWFDGDSLVRLALAGSDHSIIDSDLTETASLPLDSEPASSQGPGPAKALRGNINARGGVDRP